MQTTTTAPVLPDLDPALGDQLGDDILLATAKQEKVVKVRGSRTRSGLQSHTARAWTRGGSVD